MIGTLVRGKQVEKENPNNKYLNFISKTILHSVSTTNSLCRLKQQKSQSYHQYTNNYKCVFTKAKTDAAVGGSGKSPLLPAISKCEYFIGFSEVKPFLSKPDATIKNAAGVI